MRYCPAASVVAVRTLSISAGLDAAMVTPGSTAPEGSLTVTARGTCDNAASGRIIGPQTVTITRMTERILTPLQRSPSADLGLLLYRKTADPRHEYPLSDRRARVDIRRASHREGI